MKDLRSWTREDQSQPEQENPSCPGSDGAGREFQAWGESSASKGERFTAWMEEGENPLFLKP